LALVRNRDQALESLSAELHSYVDQAAGRVVLLQQSNAPLNLSLAWYDKLCHPTMPPLQLPYHQLMRGSHQRLTFARQAPLSSRARGLAASATLDGEDTLTLL
jgi:hypothetical protein